MKGSVVVLIVVWVLMLLFGVLNIDALSAMHSFNLLFVPIFYAPMGLVLLVLAALLSGVFVFLDVWNDLRAQAHLARYLKQLDQLRDSLDREEASRFEHLQQYLEERLSRLESQNSTSSAAGSGAFAQNRELIVSFNQRIDTVRDELAADIGQLEDSLSRKIDGQAATGYRKM